MTEVLPDAAARHTIRTALHDNVVVEAAAGTGKTTELTARLIALLATGVPPSAIAAMTFTERAAGELKLRLRAGLEAAHKSASGTARVALTDALLHLEDATISTIHGFCAELLSERPIEAGLEPGFRTLSAAEADAALERAAEAWLADELGSGDDTVRRALRRIRDGSPARAFADIARPFLRHRDTMRPWRMPELSRARQLYGLRDRVRAVAEQTMRPDDVRDSLYAKTAPLREAAMTLRQLSFASTRGCDDAEALLSELGRRLRYPPKRGPSTYRSADGLSRAGVCRSIEQLVDEIQAEMAGLDAELAAQFFPKIGSLIERYDASKRAAACADFDDLVLLTRRLLSTHPEVRLRFSEKYRAIFVDEFQDTDPVQIEVLLLLAATPTEQSNALDPWTCSPRPGRLFVVGDPKQSIYRFRGADLDVYQRVIDHLVAHGATRVQLTTSFRAVPAIAKVVNAAFSPVMDGDRQAVQAHYVALAPHRRDLGGQPGVVALPIPAARQGRVYRYAVNAALPREIADFVASVLAAKRFQVLTKEGEPRPLSASDICILYRQFRRFDEDATVAMVDELNARQVPHVLIGARASLDQEETDGLLTALMAVEWPGDELYVYAMLRGGFFGFRDETLEEYKARYGRIHPLARPCTALPKSLDELGDALGLIARLHRMRSRASIADVLATLLGTTKAHVGYAMRPAGAQALFRATQMMAVAHDFEAHGGRSFRAFVEHVGRQAERRQAEDASVAEQDAEGVRIMTVHQAKGLEFPVVILADPATRGSTGYVSSALDREEGVFAARVLGCAPLELTEREAVEKARDAAEATRIAYVAATRARDLLVVPIVDTDPTWPDDGWLRPLADALRPRPGSGPDRARMLSFPAFDAGPVEPGRVAPGFYLLPGEVRPLVWDLSWNRVPRASVRAIHARGLTLLSKEADSQEVERGRSELTSFRAERAAAIAQSSVPSIVARTATELAHAGYGVAQAVRIYEVEAKTSGVWGALFGNLVHETLRRVSYEAAEDAIAAEVNAQGFVLGADERHRDAAVRLVAAALAHDVMRDAARAEEAGECRREAPVQQLLADGSLVEGVADLAFCRDGVWYCVDFKTDRTLERDLDAYKAQVGLYAEAIAAATGAPCEAILLWLRQVP